MALDVSPLTVEPVQKTTVGLFYQIKDVDDRIRGYVLGTVHMLNMYNLKINFDKEINRCLSKSSHMVVELDAIKLIKSKLKGHSTEEESTEFLRKTAEDVQSLDLKLLLQANDEGKPIHELETEDSQLKSTKEYSDNVWDNVTSKMLKRPLHRLTPDEEVFYKELDRKLDERDLFVREGFEEGSEDKLEVVAKFGLSEEVSRRFYDDRNEKMAEKVDSLLRENQGCFFIAVGAGHVVGNKGVPALLSKVYNWQIEKL